MDIAIGTSMYKAVKYSLYEATEKLITPILNRLANESLLDICKNVSKQNTNHSFRYGVSFPKIVCILHYGHC